MLFVTLSVHYYLMRYAIFFITIFIGLSLNLSGQSKRSLRFYNDARQEAARNNLSTALELLNKALDDSPDYLEAILFISDIYRKMGQPEKSLPLYEQSMKMNPPYYVYLFYGEALYETGNYELAMEMLERYRQSPKADPRYLAQAEQLISNAGFAMSAVANPKEFNPQNLGSNVNSKDMEYFPSISADGNTLVFTHRALEGERQDEDFYISRRDSAGAEWSKAEPLRGFLNTTLNEGAQTMTSDGNVIFFAACERQEGFGSCDIYASFLKADGSWSRAVNLGEGVNSRLWESQPSVSSDGRTLYFVRGSSSISRNIDIYYSELTAEGRWGKAKKLVGEVNTPAQESSPFIHFDNQSLYFSSNGHPGMGDLDFFVSRRQADGSWGKPENLGYPINTNKIEFSLIVAPDGKTGYYASDKAEGNHGLTDLYFFELPEESRAVEIAYIRGKVINQKTREPISAPIEFKDINKNETVLNKTSARDGNYFAVLPGNSDYALNVRKKGFLFYSRNFSLATQTPDRAFVLNVELIPIEVGQRVKLENVFFATDSYQLDQRSHAELDEVAEFLRENPQVKIMLEGHTDSEGEPAYNQTLSENRAKSVMEYLLEKGIDQSRLTSAGYGDTQPVATNDTPEGRKLNRRTELKITGS